MDTGTDGSTVGLSGHVTDSISFTFLGGETSRDSSAANGLSSGKKKKKMRSSEDLKSRPLDGRPTGPRLLPGPHLQPIKSAQNLGLESENKANDT